jgi:hypothetical protein
VEIISVIHASAWVSSLVTVKHGAVILAQAVVGPSGTAERGTLLNTGASLDHESTLEDFSALGPGGFHCSKCLCLKTDHGRNACGNCPRYSRRPGLSCGSSLSREE